METSSCKDVRKTKKDGFARGQSRLSLFGDWSGGEAPGNLQRRVTGSSNFSTPFIPLQRMRPRKNAWAGDDIFDADDLPDRFIWIDAGGAWARHRGSLPLGK